MRDFLGQKLKVGDFVVYPGGGNTNAEYGLILHKIVKVDEDKQSVRTERLDVWYKEGGGKNEVRRQNSTIKALTKLVRVTPPKKMVEIFESGSMEYFSLIGKWLHGRTEIDWNTLEVSKMRD